MAKPCSWDTDDNLAQIESAYTQEGIGAYWPEEKEPVRNALAAICRNLAPGRYQFKEILGVGGSGIVARLSDSHFPTVDNALKFPRPVPGKVALVASLLTKEIKYLAQLRHANIVRILDYGEIPNVPSYRKLPYYLMEAVEGSKSRRYIKEAPSTERLLQLVRDAADVLCYLHSFDAAGFAHLDLKPGNFVVDKHGRAIMIDLGTCKRLSATDADETTIACTQSFAHPELVRTLMEDPSDENRAKGNLPRSTIKPIWDLWSLGLTIVSWLGLDHKSGEMEYKNVIPALDVYTRKYLFLLIGRLLAGPNIPLWLEKHIGLSSSFLASVRITNSEELRDLVLRVQGSSNPLLQIPELAAAQTNTVQAAPDVHVAVTEALKEVLYHRLFRRLNSISQLGLVSQVYPGAKHSRREHSLGTYANVQRMVSVLYNDQSSPLFRQLITEGDIRALLLAALLHDLGHFPLAHDLEEIDSSMFDHAEITESMLRGVWEKKKRGSRKLKFESLDHVFELWKVPADRVLLILNAKPGNLDANPKDKLLRSIISGPIDADKLDYLFRDSRHLDLPYPRGIDVERLFGCLTTVVVSKHEGGARDVPVLGVQAKGKVTAEFLTMARYAMFSQAYWHHAVRAQKAMLFRAVEALLVAKPLDHQWRELQSDFIEMVAGLPESLYRPEPEARTLFDGAAKQDPWRLAGRGTDLSATDAAVLSWFQLRLEGGNAPEARLIESILRRQLFKRLWVVSREMEPGLWDKIVERWGKLQRLEKHKLAHAFEATVSKKIKERGLVDVTEMAGKTASERIERATAGRTPWLLIDVPGERPGSEVPLYYVLEGQRRSLRKDDRSVGDLQQSEVWVDYAKNLIRTAGKVRVFCDPELVDSVEASIEWPVGAGYLLTAIDQVSG
jgi:HD superfamily phosphohydrolase